MLPGVASLSTSSDRPPDAPALAPAAASRKKQPRLPGRGCFASDRSHERRSALRGRQQRAADERPDYVTAAAAVACSKCERSCVAMPCAAS